MISILRSKYVLGVVVTAIAASSLAGEAARPTEPVRNPYLADSTYPVAHGYSDFTTLPGPVGPSRQLHANEIIWKGVGPVNGFAPTYSGLYPNGKRVMWLGGYDRITKLDADSMSILSTYAIGGNTYFGAEEIERHISTMDHMSDADVATYEQKLWRVPFRSVQASYRMISKDHELYIPLRLPSGTISLQVFGDAIANDPTSDIVLKREWKIPAEVSKANIMSVNMTYDGWVVMVTQDGVLIALSRDFTTSHIVKLPRTGEEPADENFFNAFVRNGLTVDDHGGVYVVTRDNMHRVQWTGSKLSLDETDGAWSAPYPNELGVGSGTTPTPMGWGPNEDHLVVIADGTNGNNAVAFWRDAIPADWKGLPGHDRRIAGITPVHFGVSPDEVIQVENAALVYGYGAFFNNFDNSFVAQHLPKKGGAITQKQESSGFVHMPGHNAAGGSRINWDPKSRTLNTVWKTQVNFVNTVCTISGGSDMVYCWGLRNKQWTLEGTDWKTGASAFHYTLGKSKRYDALGGPIVVGPHGVINCGCSGGLGLVQVRVPGK